MTYRLLSIICISLLSACAGNTVKDSDSIQQSAIQQAKTVDKDPLLVIASSQTLQLKAQKEDLYFYSPTYMKQGEDALEDAEEALKDKKPALEIIAHALTAQKLFDRGLKNKPTVLIQLKLTFDGLEMLKQINTDTLLTSDFQDLQDDTKDLIVLIEQGKNTDAITEQKSVLSDIAEIEIKTLKRAYLESAKNALEKAEDADAEDFAAKSYKTAETYIESFETFISTSPKQREAIKTKSMDALHLALHAENTAKAAKPLIKLTPETAEDHILFVESLMTRIATALEQDSVKHLNLTSQSIAITQTAETINKRARTQTQAAAQADLWNIEKQTLQEKIESLEAKLNKPESINPENSDVDLNESITYEALETIPVEAIVNETLPTLDQGNTETQNTPIEQVIEPVLADKVTTQTKNEESPVVLENVADESTVEESTADENNSPATSVKTEALPDVSPNETTEN